MDGCDVSINECIEMLKTCQDEKVYKTTGNSSPLLGFQSTYKK